MSKKSLWASRSRSPKQVLSESFNLLMKGVMKKKRPIPFRTNENEEKPKEEQLYIGLPYSKEKVYELVAEIIEEHFKPGKYKRYRYAKADNGLICQRLSQKIKDQLKTWPNLIRHRIIALISIVEKQQQGIHYRMKYSLDTRNDGYINYTYNHPQIFVLACVMLIKKN